MLVGDGSYLMMNSEIATSVAGGHPLLVVLCDNRGFGCIHRLQRATAGEPHNNLLKDSFRGRGAGRLRGACPRARRRGVTGLLTSRRSRLQSRKHGIATRTTVIVIETDPQSGTAAGGAWWNVPVAEVSGDPRVRAAREAWRRAVEKRR